MDIKYRELMKEYKLKLDNPVLDPGFVSKANTFEEKLKNNELTDEEAEKLDDELVELFKNSHNFEEEDSDELKEIKHQKAVSDAKADIAEAGNIDLLKALQKKFKDLPEVQPLIEKKLAKLQEDAENSEKMKKDKEKAEKDKFIVDAKKEITAAKYDDLQAIGEKYKEYPELVEIIKKRHADEKPGKDDEEIAVKLRSKREWTYRELQAMNIKPTGNDMTVAGVRLEKEYLLNIYSVRK